jgi:hypothetical protein
MKLSDSIRARMAQFADDRQRARKEGIAIAKSLLDTATELFNGIYLITPFMCYEMSVELVEYISQKSKQKIDSIS